MNGKIYCITCLINNKKYIGQTKGKLSTRIKRHQKDSERKKPRQAIHYAIAKYSFENFSIKIIEDNIDSLEQLNQQEKYWINKLKTIAPAGYNLTNGGENYKISEITREKLSGPNNHFYGKKHTKETRQKMSEAQKGRVPWNKGESGLQEAWNKGKSHSENTKNILSKRAKNQFETQGHPRLGKKHSEKTKNKISKSKIGKPGWKWTEEYKEKYKNRTRNPNYKGVKLTREQVEEIRRKYKSNKFTQVELGRQYNVHRKTISRIVNYKAWL